MMKRAKTVSINLRLPADLHKKLVEAAADTSPPKSLNSEILARLFESFDRATEAQFQKLEEKVRAVEVHALKQIKKVQDAAVIRMEEVEKHAEKLAQEMESSLAKTRELQRRAEAKLK
jgi:Arc-like DNA binding domain